MSHIGDDATIAMQSRCVHCLSEQYVLAVIGVSTGELGCSWCGQKSRKMTPTEYRDALKARRTGQPAP